MWTDKLSEIVEEKKSYAEKINSGASSEEVERFLAEVKHAFHFDLPKEYIEMLKVFDGLEFNGVIIYGIDEQFVKTTINQHINGFIDNNQIWYENKEQKKYIFFADRDISWFCLDAERNIFVELDKSSGDLQQEFASFSDMLEYVLEQSLS